MRVFLTGGSGYIGQATIQALRQHGHEVTALVRSNKAVEAVTSLKARAAHGDLGDLEVLRQAASEADGAIHSAQDHGSDMPQVDRDAAAAIQDGLGTRPYVHTSGTWVYGDTAGVVDEDAPFAPPQLVAWRLDNETLVPQAGHSGGHPVMVVPGLVYGARRGLIDQFIIGPDESEARSTMSATVPITGPVHVDDIADLYALALDAPASPVFTGVADHSLTVADLLPALSEAAGCPGHAESITLEQSRTELTLWPMPLLSTKR